MLPHGDGKLFRIYGALIRREVNSLLLFAGSGFFHGRLEVVVIVCIEEDIKDRQIILYQFPDKLPSLISFPSEDLLGRFFSVSPSVICQKTQGFFIAFCGRERFDEGTG